MDNFNDMNTDKWGFSVEDVAGFMQREDLSASRSIVDDDTYTDSL